MDTTGQRQKADLFRELHKEGAPLVLFNAWDVATAKAIATASAAVGTSSGAMAAAQGFADGEKMPFDLLIGFVARMAAAVSVPITIDLEAGYGETPEAAARSALAIFEAGAVGINIEDGLVGGKRQLASPEQHARKIGAIRDAARTVGFHAFINARIDPFLLKIGTPDECLAEAASRANIYAEAGADGVFVPGLIDLDPIRTLVRATPLPLNVMAMRGAPAIVDFARAGVRRVSLGPWPMSAAMRVIGQAAADVEATRDYGPFLQPAA